MSLTVKELAMICKNRGLKFSGKTKTEVYKMLKIKDDLEEIKDPNQQILCDQCGDNYAEDDQKDPSNKCECCKKSLFCDRCFKLEDRYLKDFPLIPMKCQTCNRITCSECLRFCHTCINTTGDYSTTFFLCKDCNDRLPKEKQVDQIVCEIETHDWWICTKKHPGDNSDEYSACGECQYAQNLFNKNF